MGQKQHFEVLCCHLVASVVITFTPPILGSPDACHKGPCPLEEALLSLGAGMGLTQQVMAQPHAAAPWGHLEPCSGNRSDDLATSCSGDTAKGRTRVGKTERIMENESKRYAKVGI